LLRNTAAAQIFFVNLLAEMQWSGYTILVLIGLNGADQFDPAHPLVTLLPE
jgi:hypothetical protein